MATHSSSLAQKIPWMKVPGRLQPWDCKESDTTEQLHFFAFKGDFNPMRVTDWREYTKRVQGVNKMEAEGGNAEGELRREGYTVFGVLLGMSFNPHLTD